MSFSVVVEVVGCQMKSALLIQSIMSLSDIPDTVQTISCLVIVRRIVLEKSASQLFPFELGLVLLSGFLNQQCLSLLLLTQHTNRRL